MTKKLLRQRDGASLVDYGMLTGLISVIAIGAVLGTGTEIRDLFRDAGTEIAERRTGTGGPTTGTPGGGGEPEQVVEEEEEVVLPYVRAAGGTTIIDNGTLVSADIPASSEEGDVLVAFVTHRSALTAPAGWEIEGSQKAYSYDQWLTVLTKPFVAGDTSVTFSQTNSNRMLAHVVTVAGTDPQVANLVGNNGNTSQYIGPSYVVAGSESLSITGRTEVYANGSGPTTITPTVGWTLTTPPVVTGNRMGVAWNRETAGTEGTIVAGPALTDDGASNDWGAVVVQFTTGGVAAPYGESFGPYDPYIDPLAFLMLTDDADTASVSGYPGVYAKAGNDTLNGTSATEIFIPGPGNDLVRTNGGSDTIIFAPGDGQDVIDPASGFETLILTGYPSTDAIFRGVNQGNDVLMYLPSGDQVYVDGGFYSTNGALDAIQFSDGVTMNIQQMIDKAADDAKVFGTVLGSRMNDYHFHTESVDGSYMIEDAGGTDVLEFTETTSTDAKFGIHHLGYDMIIETPDGDRVTIDTQTYSYSNIRMETITFSDGVSMDIHQQLARAAADQKPSGTVYGTQLNEAFVHTASLDGSYKIEGNHQGNDSLTFTETAYENAAFKVGSNGQDLIIDLPDSDRVIIDGHFYGTTGRIETLNFAGGGSPSYAQQLEKALNDAKATGTVNFSQRNDTLTHTQAVDGNYLIVGAATTGTDSLIFSDVTSEQAVFYTNGAANIMIETPDGDTITIQNYRYLASPWLETITFSDGVTVTRAEILANSTEWGTSLPAPG